jgi:hypothetical protein
MIGRIAEWPWTVPRRNVTLNYGADDIRFASDRRGMQTQRPSNVAVYGPAESDVRAFIRAHALAPWIDEACKLIADHFDVAGDVVIDKGDDPEFDDEWVTLRVNANGEPEQVLSAYDAFTRDMVRILPPGVGRRIRLSLGIA